MKTTNNSAKDIMNETYCEESNYTKNSINDYHNNYEDDDDDDDYIESNCNSSYDNTNKYHDADFPDDYDWM